MTKMFFLIAIKYSAGKIKTEEIRKTVLMVKTPCLTI
jgi:hypothetical protein